MLHNQAFDTQQLISNPALLEDLLLKLTQPTHVAQATQALTNFLANIESCGPLLQCLAQSNHKDCRNLAAVYLRKKMSEYSELLGEAQETQIKQILVERLANEPDVAVLRGLGALVIQVARLFSWHEELLQVLANMFQSGNTVQQEIAVTALRNMVAITEGEPLDAFLECFGNGLNGTERMQIESLKGLAALAPLYEGVKEHQEKFKQVFQTMAAVCQKYVTNEDEKLSRYVVEMWDDLLSDNALSGAETEIFGYMLEIGARKDLKVNVRYQVVDYMKHYVQRYPNRIIAENLLKPIMQFCITLLMENYNDENPDDISNPLNMSIEIMDSVFLHVRVDHTSNLALQGVQDLIKQDHIKSALALLAIMTEGCAVILREEELLDQLKNVLDNGMGHPDSATRKVAYEALTQFVYHISPQMNKYADSIMPAIFRALQMEQNNSQNLESVCISLDSYASALGENIVPYIDSIVDVLIQLLTNGDIDVKEAAVSALASTISTSRDISVSVNRVQELAQMLLEIINQANSEEMLKLRGEATNCMGEICLTIGAEQTQAFNNQTNLIRTVLQGINFECTDLKEATFTFFGTMAQLFQGNILETDEFKYMFDQAIQILNNEEGLVMQEEDDGFGNTTNNEMNGDELGDDDLLTTYKFYCQTGFLEEKTAAAGCLEMFARYCGPGYAAHWDQAVEAIIDCMSYPHPTLKQAITRAFHFQVENILKTLGNAEAAANLPEKIINVGRQTVSTVVTLYLVTLVREDDRDCCVETLISISELLKINTQVILGLNNMPVEEALANGDTGCSWDEFMDFIQMLFDEKAECQSPDDIQLETKRESEDNPILDGLTDICQSLSEGLTQEQLLTFWDLIFPKLPNFLTSQRSHVEYSLAIGCMGDVSSKIEQQNFQKYLAQSMEMAFTGLNASNHHLVRQNSVYALGCICRAGGNSITSGGFQVIEQMLQFLHPICQMPRGASDKRDQLLRDNGFSTLGSMLGWIDIPENRFPDLFTHFLSGLPIEKDYAENQWVIKSILRLLVNKQHLVQPYFQAVGQILQSSLSWEQMPDEVKQEAQNAIFVLNQQNTSASI